MAFDIVQGKIANIIASEELIKTLRQKEKPEYEETLYLGYPLFASAESAVSVDALLLSERRGVIAFIFSKLEDVNDIIEEQDELYYQLTNTLTQYPSLRKGRSLAFEPYVISIIPNNLDSKEMGDGYVLSTSEQLSNAIEQAPAFDVQYYRVLDESLQKIASIKPRKKRENINNKESMGSVIKEIEKEIANLDKWQRRAALEIVDGPQRIRGLAGSGKTIVLALKAAYLHTNFPEWDIVITYYTRSLWQQYRDLITKFVFEFSRDEPNWEKLHLFHAWGSQSEEGLYSEIARSINQVPMNFINAKLKFGNESAFAGICNELNQTLSDEYRPLYDALLIDEAQDMPASFFQLTYKCVRNPKRIVWAYDELQNLNSSTMPLLEEMFGVDGDSKPLLELSNEPDEPMQDIILPVCYRNPPWVLALAHSLGFGIYRDHLVQHFEALELWEDIGYKIEKGTLDFGKRVILSRGQNSTPSYFYTLLKPEEVINAKRFDNFADQYDWIAKQIKKNIEEDELDPDDILVIFPSVIFAKSQYQQFARHLARYSISSMLAGVTHDRDIFRISGRVTCSTIYRAKGNESPMVYVANADYCYEGMELIKLRNTLFTAITRSRAWVRICGVGSSMDGLINEIRAFIDKKHVLDFKIPTKSEMKRLKVINRERTPLDSRKIEEAQKGLRVLLDLVDKGEIDASQLTEFRSLMRLVRSGKFGGEEIDQEN